jgi:hypothetical protein
MASPKKASRDAGRRAADKVNALAELESRDRCRSRPRPRGSRRRGLSRKCAPPGPSSAALDAGSCQRAPGSVGLWSLTGPGAFAEGHTHPGLTSDCLARPCTIAYAETAKEAGTLVHEVLLQDEPAQLRRVRGGPGRLSDGAQDR